MTDTPKLFTLKQLNDNTVDVIREIHESGEPAVITRHGRFLAVIHPLPDGIESELGAALLKELGIKDVGDVFTSEEALASLSESKE